LSEKKGTGIPKIIRELKNNGSPEIGFEMDEERTYINTIIHIRENFSENNFSCESMSKLEISRITKVLEYLDDYYEVTSSIVSELLNVEVKTASRLLSKAEKIGILISDGKTKNKIYKRK